MLNFLPYQQRRCWKTFPTTKIWFSEVQSFSLITEVETKVVVQDREKFTSPHNETKYQKINRQLAYHMMSMTFWVALFNTVLILCVKATPKVVLGARQPKFFTDQ